MGQRKVIQALRWPRRHLFRPEPLVTSKSSTGSTPQTEAEWTEPGGVLRALKSSTGWKRSLDPILLGFSGSRRMPFLFWKQRSIPEPFTKEGAESAVDLHGSQGTCHAHCCLTGCFSSHACPRPPGLGVLWPRGPVYVAAALTRTEIPGEPYAGTHPGEDSSARGQGIAHPCLRALHTENGWASSIVPRLPDNS